MERVLVVPRDALFFERYFQGFLSAEEYDYLPIIKKNKMFLDRNMAEKDPNFKQIIPYNVFILNNKVFLMQRTKNQTEERLHDKLSLGIGGHINEIDHEEDIIELGRQREFLEEVNYYGGQDVKLLGYINDDHVDVGKVHFGLVFLIKGDNDKIEVREKDKMTGRLLSLSEVRDKFALLEEWSKIVFKQIDGPVYQPGR